MPKFDEGGELHEEKLTLKTLGEHIAERFPKDKVEKKAHRSDRRIIEDGDTPVLQLYTPTLRQKARSDGDYYHGYHIHIAPPPAKNVNRLSGSDIVGNLNTSSPELALQRLRTLQNIAEFTLQRFFAENPGINIPTQDESRLYDGKTQPICCFRNKQPGENPKANEIFFEDLKATVIEPALKDFDRYIYWKTDIKKANDGKWQVTFQAKRNTGEDMPPDTSHFSGPFTVSSASEEDARAFAHALELAILELQSLQSRERAVDQFGEATKALVVRESLKKTLLTYKDRIDLQGSNVLTQLLRDRRPDFH